MDYRAHAFSDPISPPPSKRRGMMKRAAKTLGEHLKGLATEEYTDPVTGKNLPCIPPGILYATHPTLTVLDAHASAEKRSFAPSPPSILDNLLADRHGHLNFAYRATELKGALGALSNKPVALRHGRNMPAGMDWYTDIKAHGDYHCTQMENQVRASWTKGGNKSALHALGHGKHIVDKCSGREQWLPGALAETGTVPASITFVDIVGPNNGEAIANWKKAGFGAIDHVGLTGDCLDKRTYGKRLDQLNASDQDIVVMVWGNTVQDFDIPDFLQFQTNAYKESTAFMWSLDHTLDPRLLDNSYGKAPVPELTLNAIAQYLWFRKHADFPLQDLGVKIKSIQASSDQSHVYLCAFDKNDPEGTEQVIRPIAKPSEYKYAEHAFKAGQSILHRTRADNLAINPGGNSLAGSSFDYNITVSCQSRWSGAGALRQQLNDFRI